MKIYNNGASAGNIEIGDAFILENELHIRISSTESFNVSINKVQRMVESNLRHFPVDASIHINSSTVQTVKVVAPI